MKAELWQRAKEIYNSALERQPGQREAYIAEACAGDEPLRKEVESMLGWQTKAEDFIESPALEVAGKAMAGHLAAERSPDLTGRRLLHYRIDEKIGEGGMGVVYRATDTRLKRQVAIKVIPEVFAADQERLARFGREAELLASLNHPNIAAIHGLEQTDGKRFLVLELVEGETLAHRTAKGPLPVDEALEVCRQIAEGLEAAHEKGIIHRDLKPANVKITPEGKAKVLDFGLAKAFQEEMAAADASDSPILTNQMTRPGVILGTAAYMSPEQARGKPVDKRADIWAFGCILYECLTGNRAFEGETITETLAAILKGEPNWQILPAATPWRTKELLHRCLDKDPKHRLHDIGDAKVEVEMSLLNPEIAAAAKTNWRIVACVAVAGLLLGAAVSALMTRHLAPSGTKSVVRTRISVDPATQLGGGDSVERGSGLNRPSRTSLAVSPDGQSLVFGGAGEKGPQLFLRVLDKWDAVPIAGTEGGLDPFISPDGQWVGFWAGGQLKKVSVGGGTPVTLCDLPSRSWGVSWGTNGTIVLSDLTRLLMVPDTGGKAEVLTAPDQAKGELQHFLPHVLPGGEAVLFSTRISPSRWDNPRTEVLTLKSGTRKILLDEGADARYAESGHIIFVRQGMLCAVAFDISRLAVTAAPVQLIANVMQATNASRSDLNSFAAQFTHSASGTLAYVTGGPYPDADRWLAWIDAKGTAQPVLSSTASYFGPRVSPDGKRVVYFTRAKKYDIFVADLERGVSMPLTFSDENRWPIWTPDGRRVTFSREEKSSHWRILWASADGSGEAESLIESDCPLLASSWSSSGDRLAYVRLDPTTGYDVWVFRTKDRKSEPFLNTRFSETHPEFTPDGRWLAYVSNESGRVEVYVQSYPDRNRKIKISSDGGSCPCWRRDGRQLYFLSNTGLMVVDVAAGPTFGTARVLLDNYLCGFGGTPIRSYDLHPDGLRFLAPGDIIGGKPVLRTEVPEAFRQALETFDPKGLTRFESWLRSDPQRRLSPSLERQLREPSTVQINIVQNWFEELKRLVPTGKK